MKLCFKYLTQFIFLALTLTTTLFAGNRFNVLTYQDPADVENLEAFYKLIDSFGVSIMHVNQADSAGYYKQSESLNYELITTHWLNTPYSERIKLLNNSFDLYIDSRLLVNTRMNGTNTDPLNGYVRKTDTLIGGPFNDPDFGDKPVLRAIAGTHSAGLLHSKFSEGVFNWFPLISRFNEEFTLSANLRCLNIDTTGIGNAVVARLVVWELGRFVEGRQGTCLNNTLNKYVGRRLITGGDTLLIVGSSNGIDTVDALNFVPDSTFDTACGCPKDTVWVSKDPEYCATDSMRAALNYNSNYTCYLDGSDTICIRPYRYTRDIKVQDFANTSSYHAISMKFSGGDYTTYAYELQWTGVKTVYLDSFFVYNNLGLKLDTIVGASLSNSQGIINNWYSTHTGAKGQISSIYTIDEPRGPEFQTMKKLQTLFSGLSADTPDKVFTTLFPVNNPNENQTRSRYFDTYVEFLQPEFFAYDHYLNLCWITSSSDVYDTTSFQYIVDRRGVGTTGYVVQLNQAKKRSDIMGVDFWLVLPMYAEYSKSQTTDHKYPKIRRLWTSRETWGLVNLALSFGAHGIGYWPTMGNAICDIPGADPCEGKFPGRQALHEIETQQFVYDFTEINDAHCSAEGCGCETVLPYVTKGLLVYDENSDAVTTPLWDSVRQVNMYLDSMAYFFLNAEWQSTGRWKDNIASMDGSFIDSIKTKATVDSAYIRLSFFEYESEMYSYIVNTRVDNGTYGRVDTQTVVVFMHGEGPHQIWDVYANHCDTIWDSVGVVKWSYKLDPGEAVLMKNKPLKKTWSGSLDADWTWPQFGTARLVGDLTIPSGKTLTINSTRVKMPPYSDSLASGTDNDKIEFIVNGGKLNVKTLGSTRVVLAPDTTADSTWYGIRIENSGKITVDNAIIKNAYTGIKINANKPDTIKNTRFENCFLYGLQNLNGDSTFVSYDTVINMATGYGMYFGFTDSSTKVQNSLIKDAKYGMFFDDSSRVHVTAVTFEQTGTDTAYLAAYMEWFSRPKLSGCEFINYAKGIQVGVKSTSSQITECLFDSDLYRADSTPYMNYGIIVSAGPSNTVARSCCFKNITVAAVHLKTNTGINLGTYASPGGNGFYIDSANYQNPDYYPDNAVYHVQTFGSISAMGNFWDTAAPSNWIVKADTIVDTSYAIDPEDFNNCSSEGGGARIVMESGEDQSNLPLKFTVSQNFPNPFNPITVISFTIPEPTLATLDIFNVLGQRVRRLIDREVAAGEYQIEWDGRDTAGNQVTSGVYFYKIIAGENVATKKMLLLK